MMIWAAMLVMMPYSLARRKYDALASWVILFGMLSFDVMIMIITPNPDMVELVRVAAP